MSQASQQLMSFLLHKGISLHSIIKCGILYRLRQVYYRVKHSKLADQPEDATAHAADCAGYMESKEILVKSAFS